MLRSTLRRIWSYYRRNSHDVPPPSQWMMEITNRCNLRCVMCTRHTVPFTEGDMSLSFFKQLIDKATGLDAVWPYGFGEPMLHPELWQMVRHAKERGIPVSLSTNATLLSASCANELLRSGLDYLILAVDGATQATYEHNRRGARFDSVTDNIERFLAMKQQRNAGIHVTVQMIRLRNTTHEAASFRQMWRRPGVDRVRVREDLAKLPIEGEERPSTPAKRIPCYFLWRGPLFVQAAGTVLPCPYYHGSEPFGDLRRETAEQAWNSPMMIALRKAHIAGNVSAFPVCQRCPRSHPHPLVAMLGFFASTDVIRKYLPVVERIQERLPWKLVE